MRTAEQNEVLGTFLSLLEAATGDGGTKRAAGLKPSWKVDKSHKAAAWRHLDPHRERYDEDSGAHKNVHAAWRLLAGAWQDMRDDGRLPEEPGDINTPQQPHEFMGGPVGGLRLPPTPTDPYWNTSRKVH